jgi:hypothetical protein
MIELKSKRWAKSISSRKKNVRDKTIIIHCSRHSKATEKEWCWFSVYDDVYLHSSFSAYFVILHLSFHHSIISFFVTSIILEDELIAKLIKKLKFSENVKFIHESMNRKKIFFNVQNIHVAFIVNFEDLRFLIVNVNQSLKKIILYEERIQTLIDVKQTLIKFHMKTRKNVDQVEKKIKCYCYAFVLSTNTSHLVISSSFSIKQACLIILIILQSIKFFDSLIMLRFSANELRNEQEIANENFIERFTKKFISWYSHHDLKTT